MLNFFEKSSLTMLSGGLLIKKINKKKQHVFGFYIFCFYLFTFLCLWITIVGVTRVSDNS